MVQQAIKNQIFVESMIQSIKQVLSTGDQLYILLQVNDLLHNVFLLGTTNSDIQQLLKDQIIIQRNGKLEILPVTDLDRESYLLAEMGLLLAKVLPTEPAGDDVQDRLSLLNQLHAARRFLHEEIKIFLDFLFNPQDDIPNEKKLVLYLLLSEEYRKLLQQKDIPSMTILGQKTVQMIIDDMYDIIDDNEELQGLSKGKLTTLMRKFFIIISKTVQSLRPI